MRLCASQMHRKRVLDSLGPLDTCNACCVCSPRVCKYCRCCCRCWTAGPRWGWRCQTGRPSVACDVWSSLYQCQRTLPPNSTKLPARDTWTVVLLHCNMHINMNENQHILRFCSTKNNSVSKIKSLFVDNLSMQVNCEKYSHELYGVLYGAFVFIFIYYC